MTAQRARADALKYSADCTMITGQAMSRTSKLNPRVEVRFAPTVFLVSVMREFVSSFYVRVLGQGTSQLVAMATHELLENALKYSAEEGTTLQIEVEPRGTSAHVTIRIENNASAEHIRPLQEVLARMNEAPDPMAHYLTLMRETSKRPDGSGLGLARLRAEADMKLALEVDGNRVCIVAECDVEKEKAA
jgi:two-component sensor histidine kinase